MLPHRRSYGVWRLNVCNLTNFGNDTNSLFFMTFGRKKNSSLSKLTTVKYKQYKQHSIAQRHFVWFPYKWDPIFTLATLPLFPITKTIFTNPKTKISDEVIKQLRNYSELFRVRPSKLRKLLNSNQAPILKAATVHNIGCFFTTFRHNQFRTEIISGSFKLRHRKLVEIHRPSIARTSSNTSTISMMKGLFGMT